MITDELLAAVCDGDTSARQAVALWAYRHLEPIIRRRVPAMDQDDVHHRAMQIVLEKLDNQQAPSKANLFCRWVSGVGKRKAEEYWGRRKIQSGRSSPSADLEAHPQPGTSFQSRWDWRLHLRLLSSFLRRLSRPYRDALRHRMRGGRDNSFATTHGIKKGTVRWLRHEGRKRLAAMFEAYLGRGGSLLAHESSSNH